MAASPLAIKGPGGWVDREQAHLPAQALCRLFALGDVSSLPPPEPGRIRAGAGGLVATCWPSFDACSPTGPVTTAYGCPFDPGFWPRVMAELNYQLQPVSSFLVSNKERWSMWLVKHGCSLGVTGIG